MEPSLVVKQLLEQGGGQTDSPLPPSGASTASRHIKTQGSEMHERDSCKKTHGLLLRQCKGQATVYTPGLIP